MKFYAVAFLIVTLPWLSFAQNEQSFADTSFEAWYNYFISCIQEGNCPKFCKSLSKINIDSWLPDSSLSVENKENIRTRIPSIIDMVASGAPHQARSNWVSQFPGTQIIQ